jgi:hypothetical protein
MPQGGVSSPGVVEALDVLEDRGPHYLPGRPGVAVDQLPLLKVETKVSATELS